MTSLSRTGEGNGNPLQCSCLENPRDGGAWWAGIYGVTQSRTRLKRLSSSSSRLMTCALSLPKQREPSPPVKLGKGSPLQYSCLKNPMDRGAWRAPVQGIAQSRTALDEHSTALLLRGYTRICLSICQLMFFWVIFTVGCYEWSY